MTTFRLCISHATGRVGKKVESRLEGSVKEYCVLFLKQSFDQQSQQKLKPLILLNRHKENSFLNFYHCVSSITPKINTFFGTCY